MNTLKRLTMLFITNLHIIGRQLFWVRRDNVLSALIFMIFNRCFAGARRAFPHLSIKELPTIFFAQFDEK
jgi:hypothetical protein